MAKKKLDYTRTVGSPYAAGSSEDRALSEAYAQRTKQNRATLSQGIKDVVTGRAAFAGIKTVGAAAFRAAQRGVEAIDKKLLPASYKRDKALYERMQRTKKEKSMNIGPNPMKKKYTQG